MNRFPDRREAPLSTGCAACGARVGPRGTTPDCERAQLAQPLDPEESRPEAYT
jgi:hypothetical protein